jgi:hypothetical protein
MLEFQGLFSTPEKAKEAIETHFNNVEIGGQRVKTVYKYHDKENGCFTGTIKGWGEVSEFELILPEIDVFVA